MSFNLENFWSLESYGIVRNEPIREKKWAFSISDETIVLKDRPCEIRLLWKEKNPRLP